MRVVLIALVFSGSPLFFSPGDLGASAPEPSPLSPAQVLEAAEEMSLVDLKQLAYLYARLENRTLAEPIAAMVLEEDPGDLRILLAMASMYLALENANQTLEYAKRILKIDPENKDGFFFLATGYQIAGSAERARNILLELKRLYPAGVRFPFELDLASASSLAGDWHQAMLSYQRVLRSSQLDGSLRSSVRRALDALYREHLPALRVEMSDLDAGTGNVLEYGANYSQPVSSRTRLSASARRLETELKPTTTTSRSSAKTDLFQASVNYRTSPRYEFRLTGRRFDNEFGYGGAVARRLPDGSAQVASFETRLPATDSLNLRYLSGWEKRANVLFEQLLPLNLRLRANVYFRKVYVDIHRLGSGGGADWELTHAERVADTDVFLSWRGAYSYLDIRSDNLALAAGLPYLPGSSPTPETVEGLSADRIHREGIGILLSRNFGDRWIVSANAGLDYFFFLRELAWNGGASILYRPLKSVDVAGDVSYSSADNRGDENADNIRVSLEITNRF